MEQDIRNFSELSKLIRENPKLADAQAFEWERFLKVNGPKNPELYQIDDAQEFHEWTSQHAEMKVDASVFAGKEISDSYYYLRLQHEDQQMQQQGMVDPLHIPAALAALPFLAAIFLDKPKIMQEDSQYQKIEEKLKKEWLEKNPGKDFSSQEGLDCLCGRTLSSDSLGTDAGGELGAEEVWEKKWAESV